jgi:hypothetical protein
MPDVFYIFEFSLRLRVFAVNELRFLVKGVAGEDQ